MKIRILESISNEAEGAFSNGDIVDWKDKVEAQQLIDAGVAEKVASKKKKKVEAIQKQKPLSTEGKNKKRENNLFSTLVTQEAQVMPLTIKALRVERTSKPSF